MFVDYNNTLNYWFSCEHKHPLTHNIAHIVAQVYWENQEPELVMITLHAFV